MNRTNKMAAVAVVGVLSLGVGSALYFRSPAGSAGVRSALRTEGRAATSAATPAALPPASARETAWQVGTERIYAVDFGSTLSADENAEDGWFSVVGTASLTLAVASADAQAVQLVGQLSQPNVTLGNTAAAADERLRASIADGLRLPFVVKLRPNGRIESLSASRQTDGIAHGLVRNVVGALQFVEPASGAGWSEWLTEETDHNGTYKARYRQVEPGVFDKTKLSYSFLQMAQALQGSKPAVPPKIAATTTITRNEAGVMQKVDAREKVELTLGDKPLVSASNVTLALSAVQKRTLPQPEAALLVTTQLYEARVAPAQLAQQKLEYQRKLVDGADFTTLSDDLSKLPASKENRDARLKLMTRMTALFELDPRSVASASRAIRHGSADDARTMLGALSDAHGPEPQRALADLARDRSLDPELRDSATVQLGMVEQPTADTLRELRTASTDQDPNVRGQATLSLGGAVRRSDASSGPTDTTQDVVDDFNRGYQTAQTPDERRLYLNALGNAGSAGGMASLKSGLADPDPSLRAAAVSSLRFIPGDEADALLAKVMLQDPETNVRAAAIDAVQYRTLTPLLLEAGQNVLKQEKQPQLRASVVAWFAANLFKVPALVTILQAVAASDPNEDVKRAAESALRTVAARG